MNKSFKGKVAQMTFPIWFLYSKILMKRKKLNIYSELETIELLKKGYSIGRFGDGEINIAMGKTYGINFQKYSVELQRNLQELLGENSFANEKFLIGIPQIMSTYQGFCYKQIISWSIYNSSKRNWLIKHLYDEGQGQQYGDAFFARVNGFKNYSRVEFYNKITLLKEIWNQKRILIVEGEKVRLGVDNDLLSTAETIARILVPALNAYDYYDEIVKCVVEQNNIDMVLIVAGPMATVMAYDLYKKGFQVIDIGQFNDDYKDAAMKFGGFQGMILEEQDYEKQIVCRI